MSEEIKVTVNSWGAGLMAKAPSIESPKRAKLQSQARSRPSRSRP